MIKMLRRKTIHDIRHHWKQFLAVWLVVVSGTAFYGAMYPSGTNLVLSIKNTYAQLKYMDYQAQLPLTHRNDLKKVLNLPEVEAAEGRLIMESGLQLDPQRDSLIDLRLISIPDEGQPSINISDIPVGHEITNDHEILLLKRFAEFHYIQPGDTLNLWINGTKHTLEVAGLAFNPEYLVAGRSRESPFPTISSFGVAWVRYSTLKKWAGLTGGMNDIVIRVKEGAKTGNDSAFRQNLETALGNSDDIVIRSRTETGSGGVVDVNMNGNIPIVLAFSSLFLIGGLMITAILLQRMVQSERQRIGTLRALGVRRGELVGHYITFGLLIGVTGGLVGSVLGYFLSFLVMLPFVQIFAGGYLPGYTNTPQIPFILLGYLTAIAGCTLAGAYPAWQESGTPPGIALRPPTPRSPSALARLPLNFLPLSLRQTIRNLLRVPGRSVGTALGVMAGSIMLFSSIAILDSIDSSFETYYAMGQYNLRATLGTLSPEKNIENDIEKMEGVTQSQAALVGLVTIRKAGEADFDTVAMVVDERQPFLRLSTLEGAPPFSRADGVWIGHNLQRVLGLKVGDRFMMKAGDEEKETQVLGVVSQVLGSPVFVPRSLMLDWLPGNQFVANTILVRADPEKLQEVQDEISDTPNVIAVEDHAKFVIDVRNYVEFWRQNSFTFGFFGCLLSLVVILNTVNASLHEQMGELSILRSLGVRQREIASVVLLEILIMVAAGAAVGVPVGREVGFQMVHAYDMNFYGNLPYLRPVSYWIGTGGMLLVALLAALPGLRQINQADLGQVSKSQSI